MKINLNSHVSRGVLPSSKKVAKNSVVSNSIQKAKVNNTCVINFTGGNKEHVLHIIAELPPFFKLGGVATVGNDYKSLNVVDPNNPGKSAFVIPYYNGKISYDKTGSIPTGVDVLRVPEKMAKEVGVPAGTPFFTKMDLNENSIEGVLKSGNFTLLEEVQTKKMKWGLEDSTPIKLFRVKGKESPNRNVFMVFTDLTATMKEPYADGSYSSATEVLSQCNSGSAYAKFNRATVELMPDISKAVGDGFDPGTVVCSDSQSAYAAHYMALKNSQGNKYFKGKKPIVIGHNLGAGYIGNCSAKDSLINLGVDKGTLTAFFNSKAYHQAILEGKGDEFIFNNILNPVFDTKNQISAMHPAVYYTQKGFVPEFITVSPWYAKACATNPEVTPLYKYLNKLYEEGKFKGITNPLNDPSLNPTKPLPGFMEGYVNSVTATINSKEVTFDPFSEFTKDKLVKADGTVNVDYIKSHKRELKKSLFQRFSEDTKTLANTDSKTYSLITAGNKSKELKVHGFISKDNIEALDKGDVATFVSWGRLDEQKGLDEVMDAFRRFKNQNPEQNAVLLLGGNQTSKEQAEGLVSFFNRIIEQNPDLKGSMVFIEGFTPGHAFARAADMAIFPSRFAPCELTDLESLKQLCVPLVTNCQGLQKIQESFGYKTLLGFDASLDDFIEAAKNSRELTDFESAIDKLRETIETTLNHRSGVDSNKINELIEKHLKESPQYKAEVKKFKDNVLASQLAAQMKKFVEDCNDKEKIQSLYNTIYTIDTSWEKNVQFSFDRNVSSAELYRRAFQKDAKDISLGDTLLAKITERIKTILASEETNSEIKNSSDMFSGVKTWFSNSKNKYIALGIGSVAVIGAIYGIAKKLDADAMSSTEQKVVSNAVPKNNSVSSQTISNTYSHNSSPMKEFMLSTRA